MSKVKKAFISLIDYLEANKDSKVKTILEGAIDIASAKSGGAAGGGTFLKDKDGNVVAIFCYYHKKWEDPRAEINSTVNPNHCDYGIKSTSPTGLSNMCKEGTSAWTKQHREAKKGNEELLTKVASGDIQPGDIIAHQEDIAAKRDVIITREDGKGTEEKPEV